MPGNAAVVMLYSLITHYQHVRNIAYLAFNYIYVVPEANTLTQNENFTLYFFE